jgi:hypothetical protein
LEERTGFVVEFAGQSVGVHLDVVDFIGVGRASHVFQDHPTGADFAGVDLAGRMGAGRVVSDDIEST